MKTLFYNRTTGEIQEEKVLGDGLMRLAYNTPARYFLSWPLFGTACFSRLLGWYADLPCSRRRIAGTISSLGMEMGNYVVPDGGFATFNDFFTRSLQPGARPFAQDGLASPADCRLLVNPQLQDNLCIPVKGAKYTLRELLGDEGREFAPEFKDGSLCVFRLCPADYHRFHYPDDGVLLRSWRIGGRYHSVHPMALARNLKVFTTNVRVVSILDLKHCGRAAYIEVGAFGVASIVQTHEGKEFCRGDEKGLFRFGGSTVILVLQKDAVRYDEDILKQSCQGMECLVKAGEHLARIS